MFVVAEWNFYSIHIRTVEQYCTDYLYGRSGPWSCSCFFFLYIQACLYLSQTGCSKHGSEMILVGLIHCPIGSEMSWNWVRADSDRNDLGPICPNFPYGVCEFLTRNSNISTRNSNIATRSSNVATRILQLETRSFKFETQNFQLETRHSKKKETLSILWQCKIIY